MLPFGRLLLAVTSIASLFPILSLHFSLSQATPTNNINNVLQPRDIQPPAIVKKNTTIVTSGETRWYILDVPEGSLSGGRPWPVIFSFHGRGRGAVTHRNLTNFHKPGVNHIVITPQGKLGAPRHRDETFTPKTCWEGAPYAIPYRDDVQFVRDILADLKRKYSIDDNRIYAAGKSIGAGFTGLLACRASDIFAAIAPVAGPFYGATDISTPNPDCHPTNAISIINFHGTSDDDVHYLGSPDWEGGVVPNVFIWAQWWATSSATPNQCTTTVAPVIQPEMEIYSWTGCGPSHNKEVRHYKLINPGEHDWPSLSENVDNSEPDPDGPSGPLIYLQAQVEATDLIVDFFRAHPK